ncbi:MAG: tetratricopeptide repeat protein [Leptospirales bacterium]|nr:tetratricopeptide repeat protein [Leptospirales bacterium]
MTRSLLPQTLLCALTTSLMLGACSAQIRNIEKIERDQLILKRSEARVSQPLLWKEEASADAETLNDAGVTGLRQGKLDFAEESFRKAIEKSPLFGLAYLNLARLYLISDEEPGARQVYDRLVASPVSGDDIFSAADQLIRFARVQEGTMLMESLALTRKAGARPAVYLGNAALGRQEYREADAYFERALTIEATNAEAWLGKGYIRFVARDFLRAADYFSQASAAGSKEPRLCGMHLESLFRNGQIAAASVLMPTCKGNDLDLVETRARITLALNPFDDVRPLLQGLSEEAASELHRKLFGTEDRSALRAIQTDLELGY